VCLQAAGSSKQEWLDCAMQESGFWPVTCYNGDGPVAGRRRAGNGFQNGAPPKYAEPVPTSLDLTKMVISSMRMNGWPSYQPPQMLTTCHTSRNVWHAHIGPLPTGPRVPSKWRTGTPVEWLAAREGAAQARHYEPHHEGTYL
jgi:hypothetical protein